MSWRDLFDEEPAAPAIGSAEAVAGDEGKVRVLRVDELRAVVAVLDGRGDGTTTWTDRVLVEKRHEDLVRVVRILDEATVGALRVMPSDRPWRCESDARRVGDGWLRVTDPTTGDVHEIRTTDATAVWHLRANG